MATVADGELTFHIRKLSGAQEEVKASPECTLDDFKEKLRSLGLVSSQRAFSLLTDQGQILKGGSETLAGSALTEGSTLTVLMGRARDYGSITSFDRVLEGIQYPNGVATNCHGELFVNYFFGEIVAHDKEFKPTLLRQLRCGQPSQMTFGPDDVLIIAMSTCIQVCRFTDGELRLERSIGGGRYIGVAVCGDSVFATEAHHNLIQVFDFKTGELKDTWQGYNFPCGLAIIEGELLAVADRRNNQIVITDFDGNRRRTIHSESGDAALALPNDVAVDSDGNLLVMDTGHQRIAVFDQQGAFLGSVMPGFFRNTGNTFSYLSVNAVTGAVAVSNNDDHKVVVLQPPAQES